MKQHHLTNLALVRKKRDGLEPNFPYSLYSIMYYIYIHTHIQSYTYIYIYYII